VADNAQSIMIIRHAEKPISGDSHGVTPDGDHDRASLTVSGWVRAGALIELFASASRAPQRGLGSPERIYAAAFRGDQSKRAIQTVTPLADHLGIEVDTRYQQGDEAHLAKKNP
jgi:broad specificity phosphatase PhoE